MGEPVIQFSHVSKRFRRGEYADSLRDLLPSLVRGALGRADAGRRERGEFWALKNVSLAVGKGEALGVIGHNGAGKSTLLKHMAGIMVPSEGRIDVRGRLAALIEVGAGFHPDLTGRENVFLNGVILGMSRGEVARKFDEIVAFSGLEAFIDTPVKRYSSGMYARLGFSVAAHLDPDILVIDEVLSVGDFVFRQKSQQKMRSVARGGATVLFVSHNLKAVRELCERTVLLERGSIVADGPTADVISLYLDRERRKLEGDRGADVAIRSVSIRGERGPTDRFRPGEAAWIDVSFEARKGCERIAVILQVLDQAMGNVMHTSSERLGGDALSLRAGQTCTVSFQLALHLAGGTYHLGLRLYRYDIQREFDRVMPAATFFVLSDTGVQGAANLYPLIAACSVK